ncbi:FAD/NAD(P)-binding protein [Streptomyces silvensis]|uniref:FAD-binding protein n=1 Tax=Streptomyces silvensis TaxID=1765722 RepID=A0A0W7XBK4_9ACTN|nr:FAD/NAD(P)-binding protein [Streptomyces silvensis]KUF20036.1 FAD-binding protein [Streptomyces silvensis]
MSAAPPADPSIAVVGAGPRGTSVLERLCASATELLPLGARLTVHVVDPAPPGPGRVWRTAQPPELLMNTVASQVTLFTDASVDCAGPVRPGPSLYEWAARGHLPGLGPDDYPARADYGRYLEWFFARTVAAAPEAVRVVVHPARAVGLSEEPDGRQTLVLDDAEVLSGLGAVVLAQGHLPAAPDPAQAELSAYAARHGLRHIPPANPADVDLSAVAPGEPVLLRGLGLNFFDHMALLTVGRGGRFVTGEDGAPRYAASGDEPRLYAGSRRGVPYQARGDNAKGPYGRHRPAVLTPEVIARFRKRADSGDAPDFRAEVWPLVAKEVETVHYAARLNASGAAERARAFPDRFLDTAPGSPEEALVLDEFGFAPDDRWSWERLARPYAGLRFGSPDDHRARLLDRLRDDVAQARLGNVAGPLKAALDVLRDLRNELRLVVDHGGLTGASRRAHLDGWYTPFNAFLSIGPPRRRVEELVALIEAGVVEVVGPRIDVRGADGAFHAHSPDVPGSGVRVTTLIEARLPEPDLRRTGDALLAGLLAAGQCRPHTVDGYETGGLDVTPRPYRLIDGEGRAHARRFAFGVPTEGVHWVTAAGARPGVDSVTLSDADAVARAALRAAGPAREGVVSASEEVVSASGGVVPTPAREILTKHSDVEVASTN